MSSEFQKNESSESLLPRDLPEIDRMAMRRAGKIILAALLALLVIGWFPRYLIARRTAADAARLMNTPPIVEVQKPRRLEGESFLSLPGDTRAVETTALFPRADGYLKKLYVDIGDTVEADQLLAEIDAPEIEAQLNQARAAAARAESDSELAKTTLERYQGFAKAGGVTQQQLDEKKGTERQSRAALQAAQAEVQRLSDLQKYLKVTAPFPGTITARTYDLGALLQSSNTAAGKEMFRVERMDTIRVYVNVPQSYVSEIKEGQKAIFTLRNYPGREFVGRVSRTSGSLDSATRTMLAQIDIPNSDRSLFPGMYGQIKLGLSVPPPLLIPTSAVLFDGAGVRVAIVIDSKVQLRPVTLGRDLGLEIEVLQGLEGNESVIVNPGQRTLEGQTVEVNVPQPSTPGRT